MARKIIVNCDGASRGNPGRASIGVVVRDGEELLLSHGEAIGKATNNVAEYKSLIKALELAKKFTKGEVEIIMDSELVIRQMNGIYRVKNKDLLALHLEAKSQAENFEKVIYKHVGRENKFQQKADEAANSALD